MDDRKPRIPRYFLLLIFIVLTGVLGTFIMMNWLYDALAVYESKTPNAALDIYFARIADGDMDIIRAESGFSATQKNDWEDYDAAILEKFGEDGSFAYRQVASNELDGRQVYVVYNGDKRLGEVYLYDGEGVDGGWRISTPLKFLPTYTIIAPPGATVLVNGEALSPDDAVERRELEVELLAELPQNMPKPELLTYKVDGFLSTPELTATAPDGVECVVTYNDDESAMEVTLVAADELREQIAARLEIVAKAYVRYITGAEYFGTLSSYMLPGTDFHTRMRTFDHQWYAHYQFRSFKEVQVADIEYYSDECMIGDIELISEVSKGTAIEQIELSLTMSFVLRDGQWMLLELNVQ